MLNKLTRILSTTILDCLFPVSCLSCKNPGKWICQDCLERIPLRKEQFCPICENKITPDGLTCFECRKKSPLDGMLVATSYKSVLVAQAVHTYKYRFLKDLHVPLAKLIIQAVLESQVRLPDIIVPVPLHPRRLRWRGFNQSQLLANFIAQNLTPGFPIEHRDDIIKRVRFTHPQMEVKKYSQRQKNISGAFFLRSETKSCIKNKRIFLIDDIATTGSTILECAKILKKAEAKEVFAIVVARQSYKERT